MPQCTVCQCYNGVHRCWLFVISMGANTLFPPTCSPSCFLAPSCCKTIPFLQYYRTSIEALLASGLCAIDSAYNGFCVTSTAMNSLYNERCLFTLEGVGPAWKISMKHSAVWLQFFSVIGSKHNKEFRGLIYKISYDNAKVTIDLWRTYNLSNILRGQG